MLLPCHLHSFRNFGCAPTVAAHLLRPPSPPPPAAVAAFDHLINKFMKLLPRHTRAALEPQNELIFLSCCSFSASSCKQLSPPTSPPAPLPVNIRFSAGFRFVRVPLLLLALTAQFRAPAAAAAPTGFDAAEKFCNCSCAAV